MTEPSQRSFATIPDNGLGSDSEKRLLRVVQEVLRTNGWKACKGMSDLGDDGLVLVQFPGVQEAGALQASDLDFFRFYECKANQRRKVLLLSPSDLPHFREGRSASGWLFAITEFHFDPERFLSWLGEPGATENPPRRFPTVEQCRQLVSEATTGNPKGGLAPVLKRVISASRLPWTTDDRKSLEGWALEGSCLAHFYFVLLSMARTYHQLEHDYEAKLRAFAGPSIPGILESLQDREFLEVGEDLRSSLRAGILETKNTNDRILILDDAAVPPLLCSVKDAFLPDWNLVVWPPDPDDVAFLCNYQSISSNRDSPRCKKIMGKLERAHIVLVDQFFKLESGRAALLGPGLIRGLRRVTRDASIDETTGSGKDRPAVLAFSRSGDPRTIRRALRAGAAAYARKSRLLSLPAILRSVDRTRPRSRQHLQDTFRRLQSLPAGTLGLLESIPLQRPGVGAVPEGKAREEAIRSVLGAIPKTDLHVHIGSCMAPEFLLASSAVALCAETTRLESAGAVPKLRDAFHEILKADRAKITIKVAGSERTVDFKGGQTWCTSLARAGRDAIFALLGELDKEADREKRRDGYDALRSVLHADLRISDYLSLARAKEELERSVSEFAMSVFCLRFVDGQEQLKAMGFDDAMDLAVQVYLLVLGNRRRVTAPEGTGLHWEKKDLLSQFAAEGYIDPEPWLEMKRWFFDKGAYSTAEFRARAWMLPAESPAPPLTVRYERMPAGEFDSRPIEWTLETGRRSRNLNEYLEGCEFSGSVHLKHPLLLHLFAQQVVDDFVRQRIVYAELRGSPDGYENRRTGFTFIDATTCLVQALTTAQSGVLGLYREARESAEAAQVEDPGRRLLAGVFPSRDDELLARGFRARSRLDRLHPVKIGIILVGKRHKSNRQMILEAAAGALLHQGGGQGSALSAAGFVALMGSSGVVGFDLAGQESDFPPSLFAEEFARLGRLHIPMTVHAGENASARFVEEAILELGASRVGHGLAMAEDSRLMARVREERICVELCPTSNHQTCFFTGDGVPGRTYPLRRFVEAGIPVCINTDNPIISGTSIVDEYLKASEAWGAEGMSVWEALRLIKMGFRHAFLTLPERRALIEVVDQIVADLFADDEVLGLLETLRLGTPA